MSPKRLNERRKSQIILENGLEIPILFEDRAVLAIDKPFGWMLAPETWTHTGRNLQLALLSSIQHREYWTRAHGIRFLRYVHRLDAETTGVLLLAKSQGALRTYSGLFHDRQVKKRYLAVVIGRPTRPEWVCRLRLAAEKARPAVIRAHPRVGEEAETQFRVLSSHGDRSLVEARPITGRTHQIRVHLAESGAPVLGDSLYGVQPPTGQRQIPLALRAIELAYRDPFRRCPVQILAPAAEFLRTYGFERVAGVGDPR
jgi:RluA family pseudouridine synthase